MKQYRMLFVFIAIMLVVSLACSGGSTPTAAPVPTKAAVVPQPPTNNANPPSNGNGSGVTTATDQNKLFTFEVPGDWVYSSKDLGTNNGLYSDVYMYSDTWTSPDKSGVVESVSGKSQGFDLNGTTSTKFALDLLNYYYSNTGKEGDIKITKTSTAKDGSTRFDWTSRGGDYSGISWFELRGTRTFLMWTVDWGNAADQSVIDQINSAIDSYNPKTN